MLSVSLLNQLRELAPLMELRGVSLSTWAERAGTSLLTLKRYLDKRTSVGDEDVINALFKEVECWIVIHPDGPLSAAWTTELKQIIKARQGVK